ncbi:unnamed protein product, partial [Cyprideis torosa]
VVIKATNPVAYAAKLLEKKGNQPRRLYIDFKNSYIEPRYRSPVPIADGLLKRIRTGQFSKETVRVVLDIESIESYNIFSLPDPFRVVVDMRGEKRSMTSSAKQAPPQTTREKAHEETLITVLREKRKNRPQGKTDAEDPDGPELSLAQQLGLGVRRIVIDPGHGGRDPGAIGNGLQEKDVVLLLAKKVRQQLIQELHCEVILTRETDTYLSLEERTAIANGNNADLFVSLHLNAHTRPEVNGMETYYLSLSSSNEAMRVAAFENATSELQMSDLEDVLKGIMQNS